MSITFLVAGAAAFLVLVAIAERWSILHAGAVLVLLAIIAGCALL